ncbi:ribose 5-phosphate isomerase A [Thermovirga sp.]|uniref:ribose 5-phosphate isomerase A n=1 Tax=Thermovirga sp. TaxID=2699834 RepID=UPI0025D37C02|nr:ribose 5-phosphate isomerase A [Thermovirga sp.]MBO8153675.1 ribose 5-phosphate isomerase A [Thermovirga sp.]
MFQLLAVEKIIEEIQSGMFIGLGTGPVVDFLIQKLGQRISGGDLVDVWSVPCSKRTKSLAKSCGVPVMDLDDRGVDLCVEEVDVLDSSLQAVKVNGDLLGGKIVANSARSVLVVNVNGFVESFKRFKGPIAAEIEPFGFMATLKKIYETAGEPILRRDHTLNGPLVTERGTFVVDIYFEDPPSDLLEIQEKLIRIPGVVETGFWQSLPQKAYLVCEDKVRVLSSES